MVSGIESAALHARQAAVILGATKEVERNEALRMFKSELLERQSSIEAANRKDLEAAKQAVESGNLEITILKRLEFSGKKFESCLQGIDDVIAKKDPVGRCDLATELTEGLNLYRVSCPIGVLAVIYEARPEAGIQIASLALKSGNAAILKGGREASQTNQAIAEALNEAIKKSSLPDSSIQMIQTREEVSELLKLDSLIDLVVPRGSGNLIKYIKANTKIPVLGHADGLCTAFANDDADIEKSVKILADSKTDYPAACNAIETLLVHEKIASTLLPAVAKALEPFDVQYRADEFCSRWLPTQSTEPATEKDFNTEFLSHTIAVKTVSSLTEAINHINAHGSHHTDVILTEDINVANEFMNRVDSAGVYHNCSSRFADGFRYGFGAEVGISTNRIHSRGPVGLEGLLIYKYKLYGHGNTVGEMKERKSFTHKSKPIPDYVDGAM